MQWRRPNVLGHMGGSLECSKTSKTGPHGHVSQATRPCAGIGVTIQPCDKWKSFLPLFSLRKHNTTRPVYDTT